jgi:hypothetical protein
VLDPVDHAHSAGAETIEDTVAPVDDPPEPGVALIAVVYVDRDPALPTEPNLLRPRINTKWGGTVTADGHGTETNLAADASLRSVSTSPFTFTLALRIKPGIFRPLIASHLGSG